MIISIIILYRCEHNLGDVVCDLAISSVELFSFCLQYLHIGFRYIKLVPEYK